MSNDSIKAVTDLAVRAGISVAVAAAANPFVGGVIALQWLAESSDFAASHVYSQQILDAVDAAQRIGTDKLETIDLPETYLKAAGSLAQQRAASAAHRLAAVLSEDL